MTEAQQAILNQFVAGIEDWSSQGGEVLVIKLKNGINIGISNVDNPVEGGEIINIFKGGECDAPDVAASLYLFNSEGERKPEIVTYPEHITNW